MTTFHPAYKQAAIDIAESNRVFFSDSELSTMLMEEQDTDKFQFAKMSLIDYLLDEYQIDFIRAENEHNGKGYKKATPQESIEITAERLARKFRKVAYRQRKVIDTVDRGLLPDSIKDKHDKHIVKSGLLISFLNKTPLNKCVQGSAVKVDVPKMIEG